jgi:prepilin-type N-terminal cleavage/methylation domain-containing protein
MKSDRRGFTLIELLVVISIISLLSSVVFASLSQARDKARISGGYIFESHNHSLLGGDNLIARWRFNETSGFVAYDESGNGLDLSFSSCGTSPFVPDSNPLGAQPSLSLNGSCNGEWSGAAPAITTNSLNLTYSFWIKINANTLRQNIFALFDSADQTQSPVFAAIISNSNENNLVIVSKTFTNTVYSNGFLEIWDGKWHHITFTHSNKPVTVDGETFSETKQMYVDGRLIVTNRIHNVPTSSTIRTINVGGPTNYITTTANGIDQGFRGNISNLAIYNETLIAAQVFKMYADESKQYNLAASGPVKVRAYTSAKKFVSLYKEIYIPFVKRHINKG